MSDEVSRILSEHAATRGRKTDLDPGVEVSEDTFDESGYLRLNPDVAEAIKRGHVPSGYLHYVSYGYREGRAVPGGSREPRNRLIATAGIGTAARLETEIRHCCERILHSRGGGLMLIGWIDDAVDPIDTIRLTSPQWRVLIDGEQLVRVRRQDVEEALGSHSAHPYGYFGFLFFDKPMKSAGPCLAEIRLRSGATALFDISPGQLDDIEMRNIVLTYLGSASFFGNSHVEGVACLDGGLGGQMVRFNKFITSHILATPYVERFGRKSRKPRASLIVCLYGKAEFQFVQSCLYSGLPGIEDYEFIFVSNSPELAETLLREARSASLIYGIDQTIVVLPGNAGFGGANNAAVRASLSSRVVALNPDVFPRDLEWARKHTDLIASHPASETRLFGTTLYYDDGSLMHGGMYFDIDTGLSMASGHPRVCPMVRVEHYGKGTPSWSDQFTRPRPVPAVTGAFISADRAWFEALGGFTEDYVFGHYEDADLCLKSIDKGTPPWVHDLKMWHLEGKGSTRLPPHEGGSLVNRWLFSKNWSSTIKENLIGQTPTHPLFAPRVQLSAAPATAQRQTPPSPPKPTPAPTLTPAPARPASTKTRPARAL